MERLPGATDRRAKRDERREPGASEMSTQRSNQNDLGRHLTTHADLRRRVGLATDSLELFSEHVGHQQRGSERERSVEPDAQQPVSIFLDLTGKSRLRDSLDL